MPPRKQIDFNEYWQFLDNYSENIRQFKKGEWMHSSGISYRRYSEFSNGKRSVSLDYFIKLCGGLGLRFDRVEKLSGKKFSKEQKSSLNFEAFVKANRYWLEILMKYPEKISAVKKLLGL